MRNLITLPRINNLLLLFIIAINLYIIGLPFVPQLIYWYDQHYTSRYTQLESQVTPPKKSSNTNVKNQAANAPSSNSLIIPGILLDQTIYTGPVRYTYQTLAKGIWLWPNGSTPDRGGNTILIGHRFTYTNPKGVFYELNHIALNDTIGLTWNGRQYYYKVSNIEVVRPSDTKILSQTSNPELTLYTCTTLLDPVNRLVIVANLTGES